jgi:hypothetical protein
MRKPKIDKVTWGWNKLLKKSFLISTLVGEQMNMDEFLGTYRLICMGEIKKAHKFTGAGSEEK